MRRFPVICAFAALAACGKATAPAASSDRPQIGTWGVDLASVDTTVKPSDDFFRYVNRESGSPRRRFRPTVSRWVASKTCRS